jgi:hypothetical protein
MHEAAVRKGAGLIRVRQIQAPGGLDRRRQRGVAAHGRGGMNLRFAIDK